MHGVPEILHRRLDGVHISVLKANTALADAIKLWEFKVHFLAITATTERNLLQIAQFFHALQIYEGQKKGAQCFSHALNYTRSLGRTSTGINYIVQLQSEQICYILPCLFDIHSYLLKPGFLKLIPPFLLSQKQCPFAKLCTLCSLFPCYIGRHLSSIHKNPDSSNGNRPASTRSHNFPFMLGQA